MAGEIQLNGTSFASESGGTITVNNGTIGSSVVFPAGHVIQTHFFSTDSQPSVSTATFDSFSTPFKTTITNTKSNSSFLILVSMSIRTSSGSTASFYGRLQDNTNSATVGDEGTNGLFGVFFGSGSSDIIQINHNEMYTPASHSGGSLEIEVLVKQNLTYTTYLNTAELSSSITIMEIAG
jgi:hypothetical protein